MLGTALTASRLSAAALLVSACAMTALGLPLLSSDALLDRSYESALSASARGSVSAPSQGDGALSEGLWLSRAEPERDIVGLPGAVAVGDRMTISGASGAPRTLEVVAIEQIGAHETRTDLGHAPRLLMVTAKLLGAEPARLVRFIVEADDAAPATPQPLRRDPQRPAHLL